MEPKDGKVDSEKIPAAPEDFWREYREIRERSIERDAERYEYYPLGER